MEYPKPVMKIKELKAMGFEEEWLLTITRRRNNKIAWKGKGKTSPWHFSTEELEKVRTAACAGR